MSCHSRSTNSSVGKLDQPIVDEWRHRGRSLPQILADRATYPKSRAFSSRRVPENLLAYRSAWNSSRLQNMILAVGPATPASMMTRQSTSLSPSIDGSSSSSSSGHSSDDSDDASAEGASNSVDSDDNMSTEGMIDANRLSHEYEIEEDNSDSSEASDLLVSCGSSKRLWRPTMRHGGCINTASWLDCGWRLSCKGEGVMSEECPTQLLTSGDDLLVKVWDARNAMGVTSPMARSPSTGCPFSSSLQPVETSDVCWKSCYVGRDNSVVPGNILELATLQTGHHRNIFHCTGIRGKKGKVATCGADGELRVTDLECGNPVVIVGGDRGPSELAELGFRSREMCFSHHFLDENNGLLCTERGLYRFDLRLSSREQSAENLLGGNFRSCKACAIWSPGSSVWDEGGSTYVFVGGTTPEVSLCDLRMTESATFRRIRSYCPDDLCRRNSSVSVSGLDLSHDQTELLVSYESDQIYTFPIFPDSNPFTGPSMEDLQTLSGGDEPLTELAAYGGHLNRFTFLKNAKYAGPRDEYICTGSDSGHAWIYEKSSGAVAGFLKADSSTCNGIVPHPSLPVFVTYGIDTTAKIWRATPPVDPETNDSSQGRRKFNSSCCYTMSPVARKWDEVQEVLKVFENGGDDMDVMPDIIPVSPKMSSEDESMCNFLHRSEKGVSGRGIGNDLDRLPHFLTNNLFACFRAVLIGSDDIPVESGANAMQGRANAIRLQHQAARLGLKLHSPTPWDWVNPTSKEQSGKVHPADLIPDSPTDWLTFESDACSMDKFFSTIKYGDFYYSRYSTVQDACLLTTSGLSQKSMPEVPVTKRGLTESSSKIVQADTKTNLLPRLVEIMRILKAGGNDALQEGNTSLAAKRYDKAIQYAALACMTYPSKAPSLVCQSQGEKTQFSSPWRMLIQTLVQSRLNLALLLLKSEFSLPERAAGQADLALKHLRPYCRDDSNESTAKKDQVACGDEQRDSYLLAKKLEAKAYYRLGVAQMQLHEFDEAVESLQHSIASSTAVDLQPENLVEKRLIEAKRRRKAKEKRQRKKFKSAFGEAVNEGCLKRN